MEAFGISRELRPADAAVAPWAQSRPMQTPTKYTLVPLALITLADAVVVATAAATAPDWGPAK